MITCTAVRVLKNVFIILIIGICNLTTCLSQSQAGFRKGDSCISPLLAITHEIYSNFDAIPSLDTRCVYLDLAKAFDRV